MLVRKKIIENKLLIDELYSQYRIVGISNYASLQNDGFTSYVDKIVNMPLSYVLYGKNSNNPKYMIGISYEKNENGMDSIQYFPVIINKICKSDAVISGCIYYARNKIDKTVYDNEIVLFGHQKKYVHSLINMGFKYRGIHLIGNIEKSLDYMKDKCTDRNIVVRKFDFDNDYNAIKESKEKASKYNLDERSKFSSEDVKNSYCEMLRNIYENKNGYIATMLFCNKVIGLIATTYYKNTNNIHIADIIIDPEYQRNGYSLYLYKAALLDGKKENMITYTGVTTSTAVMKLAVRLKRKVSFYRLFKNII